MKTRLHFAGALFALLLIASARADSDHTFTLDTSSWDTQPTSINVAGDFNGWNKDAQPLRADGKTWSATVKLTDGPHAYKFVADGERWLQDPKADPALDQDDGNGGKNSGVLAGASPAKSPAAEPHAMDNPADGFRFALDTSTMDPKPHTVNLAGEFNGWNKEAMTMRRDGDTFWTRVPLEEGVYQYKFVIDGSKWMTDPAADPAFENDDGNGGHNSGVLVGPDARKMAAPLPNAVNTDAILFNPKNVADLNVVDDRQLRLRVRVQDGDAEHVYALTSDSPTMAGATKTELHRLGSQWGFASYGGTVAIAQGAGNSIHYAFEFTDGTADVKWAGKNAPALSAALDSPFGTPAWAKHAVWYQIFPERFKNGDPSNDPSESKAEHMVPWTGRWYDTQPGETPGQENFFEGVGNVWKRRYGGDIQGIQQSLPYLKSLGITAIYLNPVFEAESMHKYDTTDYRHIDEHFGVKGDWPVAGETEDPATWKWSPSDKVFLDFVAEAHQQGFKVVLDGVFNHVGRPCPFFQDVLENGKNSKYADWFDIIDWGDPANWHKMDDPYAVHGKPGGIQWHAWDKNNGSLPAWKKNSVTGLPPGPMKLINDITTRWLAPDGDPSRGVDGFRLDAANEVPHPFWVQWRDVVKKAKPDAYITGEIWSPAQPWINDGKQFDAVMNYQFAMPTLMFFANQQKAIPPSLYVKKLTDIDYMYPQQASLAMMNLFDSHDTDRLASMFVNPDRGYDNGNRQQDEEGKNYSAAKPDAVTRTRINQAVAMQMTFLGAPMIYYGDEAGMWSADDPSDRQPMTWPNMKFDDPEVGFNQNVFDTYQRLIAVRNTLPALQTGDFYPIATDDAAGTLVFARGSGSGKVIVAMNRSDKLQTITFDAGGKTLIDFSTAAVKTTTDRPTVDSGSGKIVAIENGKARVEVPAYGYAIVAEKQ